MQNIDNRHSGIRIVYRELDSGPFRKGHERFKRPLWGFKVRLTHLEYFHNGLWYSAILAALFSGMVFQYNIRRNAILGEEKALIGVYTTIGIKGLSEVSI